MIRRTKALLLGLALTALAPVVVAAERGEAKPAPPAAAGSADLQKLVQQFTAQRDSVLANREALKNQLKTATAEQRKAILEKMQSQQKDLVEAQRALGRQIRDEMRKLRDVAPSGPGRR